MSAFGTGRQPINVSGDTTDEEAAYTQPITKRKDRLIPRNTITRLPTSHHRLHPTYGITRDGSSHTGSKHNSTTIIAKPGYWQSSSPDVWEGFDDRKNIGPTNNVEDAVADRDSESDYSGESGSDIQFDTNQASQHSLDSDYDTNLDDSESSDDVTDSNSAMSSGKSISSDQDDSIADNSQIGDEYEEDGAQLPLSRRKGDRQAVPQVKEPMTHEAFRHNLLATESPDDWERLYPPALWDPKEEIASENASVRLGSAFDSQFSQGDWAELEIDDFCVYNALNHKRFAGQYESLHTIASQQETRSYLLDGSVNHEGQRIVLRGAEIVKVSIGGLEREYHSCGDQLWVQTKEFSAYDCWFKFGRPIHQYRSLWLDFSWIANLAKYAMDYVARVEERHQWVALDDFRWEFIDCVTKLHGHDNGFKTWRARLGENRDIRRHLTQYGSFVRDQFYSADVDGRWADHPLWNDIGCFLPGSNTDVEKTVVTCNVASTFLPRFPQWGSQGFDLLEELDCSASVEAARRKRLQSLQIPNKFGILHRKHVQCHNEEQLSVAERTLRDASERNCTLNCMPEMLVNKMVVVRQTEGTKEYFDFALVMSLSNNRKQARIVWLTLPANTICAGHKPEKCKTKAYYPIGNELFFSDDCNCSSVRLDDIVGSYNIVVLQEFAGDQCEFFAVTKYQETEQCFVKTTKQQLRFMCQTTCEQPSTRPTFPSINTTRRRKRNSSPSAARAPLSGQSQHTALLNVSLFTGCGLLDRAIESNGHLHTTLSIDCNPFAMCSARANQQTCSDGTQQEFVVASVNEQLRKIMNGQKPYPDAGCMSAGCPCPGFSLVNAQRRSRKGQRDCTLLASTMSWIETVLPAYVIIENVPNMDHGSLSACSQAISFLVALGYQVRKVCLQASDFGGSTIRKRLFVLAAAPAYKLPEAPRPTHGQQDGLRPKFTIKNAVGDLSCIHNDTLVNVEEPYHVPLDRVSPNVISDGPNFRDLLQRMPKTPHGQGLASSFDLLTPSQQAWASNLHPMKLAAGSSAIRRVNPDEFFRTVVTGANWKCTKSGQIIHYDQDRVLSLEELARAQGVPGDFLLVGSTAQKLRQVGNAVPWCLREAVGREVVRAYLQSQPMKSQSLSTMKQEVKSFTSLAISKSDTTTSNSNDDDEDIFLSDKVTYEQALERRTKGHSTYGLLSYNTTSSKKVYTKSGQHVESSQKIKHSRRLLEVNSIEQMATYQTSSRTVLYGTNELQIGTRRSARVQKRARSTTEEYDSDFIQRANKRRAKQLLMEAQMIEFGASTEDTDSDDDNKRNC